MLGPEGTVRGIDGGKAVATRIRRIVTNGTYGNSTCAINERSFLERTSIDYRQTHAQTSFLESVRANRFLRSNGVFMNTLPRLSPVLVALPLIAASFVMPRNADVP